MSTAISRAPADIPPRGWARWLGSAAELVARAPARNAIPLGLALLWSIVGALISYSLAAASEWLGYFAWWTLTVAGCIHATAAGIVMAQATEESRTLGECLLGASFWTYCCNTAAATAPLWLLLIAAGLSGHYLSAIEAPRDFPLAMQRLRQTLSQVGPTGLPTAVLMCSWDAVSQLSTSLLAVEAGIVLVLSNCAGLLVMPGIHDTRSASSFEMAERSWLGTHRNFRRAGLAGWIVCPLIGAAALTFALAAESSIGLQCAKLALWAVLLTIAPSLMYVADREIFRGIFVNLPPGFRPSKGSIITRAGGS